MLVRRARLDDVSAVIALAQRAHRESIWSDEPFAETRAEASFHMMQKHENSVMLLGCAEGEVVGILAATLQVSYFSLDYDAVETLFYIDAEHRSSPNARALIKAYEGWATTMGASAAHLSTSQLKHAERTTALYGKLGYGISAFVHRKVLQ